MSEKARTNIKLLRTSKVVSVGHMLIYSWKIQRIVERPTFVRFTLYQATKPYAGTHWTHFQIIRKMGLRCRNYLHSSNILWSVFPKTIRRKRLLLFGKGLENSVSTVLTINTSSSTNTSHQNYGFHCLSYHFKSVSNIQMIWPLVK